MIFDQKTWNQNFSAIFFFKSWWVASINNGSYRKLLFLGFQNIRRRGIRRNDSRQMDTRPSIIITILYCSKACHSGECHRDQCHFYVILVNVVGISVILVNATMQRVGGILDCHFAECCVVKNASVWGRLADSLTLWHYLTWPNACTPPPKYLTSSPSLL